MLKQLTDRIYYLEGQEKTDRPFIYYIRGDEKSLAVEAGESANHIAYFYHELESAGLTKPDYTVISHWHWDHTFGIHAVQGTTIASAMTNAKIREMKDWEWSEEAINKRMEEGKEILYCAFCMKQEYPYLSDIILKEADLEINAELLLDLGGVECRIMPHDTPHSRDALIVYVPDAKALAVADADYEDYYDNDYRYDQKILEDYISFVSQFDFDYYLRGHEGIMTRSEAMVFLRSKVGSNEQSITEPENFKKLLREAGMEI